MANESLNFEYCRINQLHEERLFIQKKTFTKWMNTFLLKSKMEVDDIFTDLADGKKLLKLLEIISGEKLGKPNNGKMRVHKIENVNKCLAFLHTKVKLESIGAEDIVDGNKTLILGLLWTIILRFQIQNIEIEEEEETDKKVHSSKDALLLWCQRKTKGYAHTNVVDFSQSWRSGMAFNALIHSHRPDLIDYASLNPDDHIHNLNHAFEVAQKSLAIQPLLDSEDVDKPKPEERSILTYVSSYYHTFAKYNSELISGKRITNVIAQLMQIDRLKLNYETFTTSLLDWIQAKTAQLDERHFPNNLGDIQNELIKFKQYRTIEKPPKYTERSDIEALLFNIQTKKKALGQSSYVPPEGKLVQDIQKCWVMLEKAEHKRELALREEIIRLEKLDNLAQSFERKARIRKSYLIEMIQVLNDPRYGVNLNQVEATLKKHEAISADIVSRSERIEALTAMITQLDKGNYHNIDAVRANGAEVNKLWKQVLALLQLHKNNLAIASKFVACRRDIETITAELFELHSRVNVDCNISNIRAFQEYLHSHTLMEAQIASQGESVTRLIESTSKMITEKSVLQSSLVANEIAALSKQLDALTTIHAQLNELAMAKRNKLEQMQVFYRLLQDIDEEDSAISDKINVCQAILPGKDLLAIISIQQKHSAFQAEVKAHENRINKIHKQSQAFIEGQTDEKYLIHSKLDALLAKWEQLKTMTDQKSKELADAIEAFQYYADANETQSWIREKMQLIKSNDVGSDEQSAMSLLHRHARLEDEINAYKHDIHKLTTHSEKMTKSGVENLFLSLLAYTQLADDNHVTGSDAVQVHVPQVEVMYNFNGQDGYRVAKGETLTLVEKTNAEWWKVQRDNQKSGYVPANYVRQVEPKTLTQPSPPGKALNANKPSKAKFSKKNNKRRLSIVCDTETADQRTTRINEDYKQLVALCQARRTLLEDSVKMYRFMHECDTFNKWITTTEAAIINASNTYNQDKHNNHAEPVLKLRKQFEDFITELLANKPRLDAIDNMAKEITLSTYQPIINKRLDELHRKMDNLSSLQKQLARNIEGLTTVDLFNASCEQTEERINEKLSKINDSQHEGNDLKTVQALQRRHENIERELVPVEDSFKKIAMLADNVKASYPAEKERVHARIQALTQLWEQLKQSWAEKRHNLNKLIGLQIFLNSSNELLTWMHNYVRPLLTFDEKLAQTDLYNLDAVCKEHDNLSTDIKGKANDINDLKTLSVQLAKNVAPDQVAVIDRLVAEYDQVCMDWNRKQDFLRQCRELIGYNTEADRIEALTASHLSAIDHENVGNNLSDINSLMKQHDTLMHTLLAQDQRVYDFTDMSDKLIGNHHFAAQHIAHKKDRIFKLRKQLVDKAYERSKQLNELKKYHEVKADALDFLNWCAEKAKLIDDCKQGKNIKAKFKRHEAIAAEVQANKNQLDKILKSVDDITVAEDDSIMLTCQQLNTEWNKLNQTLKGNDKDLKDEYHQLNYTKAVEAIEEKVTELVKVVNSVDYGRDRRSCKQLMLKNNAIQHELTAMQNKIKDLQNKGKEFVAQGDHKSEAALSNCDKLSNDLASLMGPWRERKAKLRDSYQFYEFEFDINAELQWIREHDALLNANEVPHNLTDAHNMISKFEQTLKREVDGHDNYIKRIMHKGEGLISSDHFSKHDIHTQMQILQREWNQLLHKMDKRHSTLKACLTLQQILSECNDIEAWITEKRDILNTGLYGKDEQTVVKLLQKLKTTDLEVDTYLGLVGELSKQVEKLVQQHPDHQILSAKIDDLNLELKKLKQQQHERMLSLVELKKMHDFDRESNELCKWIKEHKAILASNDYGKDFEHYTLLHDNLNELQRTVINNGERFNECIASGHALLKDEGEETIVNKINYLHAQWNALIQAFKLKDETFIAAGKIHRFNRDLIEACDRINEKHVALHTDDFGRDTRSVHNLLRKHDIFENDLVVLEAQLQVLINDSVKLRAEYGGENANNISSQLAIVLDKWTSLQNAAQLRKDKLMDHELYFRFASLVRNLEQWAVRLINEMRTHESVRDAQSAQMLKAEHERIKAEIDAQENEFTVTVNEANNLASKPFYPEIKSMTEKLLHMRSALHAEWQDKKAYLDQLSDLNYFVRDVKQLEQLYHQYSLRLNSSQGGQTVEEVCASLKKHEEFRKLLQSQQAKFETIKSNSAKLIEKQHFDAKQIELLMKDLTHKREALTTLIEERQIELDDALIVAQLKRDMIETRVWIDEKRALFHIDGTDIHEDNDIEAMMKMLQKHQTLQAEIKTNTPRMKDIEEKASYLIKKNHPSSINIRTECDQLVEHWTSLLNLSQNMLQGFKEAKDIYDYNQNIAATQSWIRDKEVMIQFNDTGEDYEHCCALLKKLDDVGTDMKVDETHIVMINTLANKIINHSKHELVNHDKINAQRDTLNESWQLLQQNIVNYRNKLTNALEVHLLNRDLDDIAQRASEKHLLVATDTDAKSLEVAETMHRKHAQIMMDVAALEAQFRHLNDNEGRRLIAKYPELTEQSRSKIESIQDSLRSLNMDCKAKDKRLSFAITLHKFFAFVRDVENWANDLINNKLGKVSHASNVTEAQSDLQAHEYLKAEIMTKRDNHQALKQYGLTLLQQRDVDNLVDEDKAKHIQACVDKIDDIRRKLDQTWEDKQVYLQQCLELRIFNDLLKLAQSWLASKEAVLKNEDLGTNLASVDNLIKKHETFVKSLSSQERVTDLMQFAERLVDNKHFDVDSIQDKLAEIVHRRDRLIDSSKQRSLTLADSRTYFNLLRNVHETQRWLTEKIKIARDESYRDPINLISKIQRNAAFEAEIMANKQRIEAVVSEGEALLSAAHFKSEEIKTLIDNFNKLAQELDEAKTLKRTRLQEAHQAMQFFRLCDDLETWTNDTKAQIEDQDFGKDVSGAKNGLKKQSLLESSVHNQADNIEHIKDSLLQFERANHFLWEEIEERGRSIIHNYQLLFDPLAKRRETLDEYLVFYQFRRDIEDELSWITEKEIQLKNVDFGHNLQEIQLLIKKHKIFESELQVREPNLSAVAAKGHSLIKAGHVESEEIRTLTHQLQNTIQAIKDEASFRLLRLCDSLEAHQFYSDVSEAEDWINQRIPFLVHDDKAQDEEMTASLMKKLEVLQRDSDRLYSTTLTKLTSQANGLIEKNHFESHIIKQKADSLATNFNDFVELVEKKNWILKKKKELQIFERDADQLMVWMQEQFITAKSDDIGQDVEHNEKLIKQFESFKLQVASNEDRVQALRQQSGTVDHSGTKMDQIDKLWDELKEAMEGRQATLEGANKAHVFYRSAEETICWIREKQSSTVLDDVNLNFDDISIIQSKLRELERFNADLKAVHEQVQALYLEADNLVEKYPALKHNIDQRKDQVANILAELLAKAEHHKEHLIHLEKIQTYFDDYQEHLSWINKMNALITAEERLGGDVMLAQEQINTHKEYKNEIDSQHDSIGAFLANGHKIIASGHFMSNEIQGRNNHIERMYHHLCDTWNNRLTLYNYNLDARHFIQEAEQVDKWIKVNLPLIDDNYVGDSLTEVEELIIKHDEFEKTIDTQSNKLKAIQRITQLEDYFQQLRHKEQQDKLKAEQQREKDKQKLLVEEEQRKILFNRENEESRFYENSAFIEKNKQLRASSSFSKANREATKFSISAAFSRKGNKVKPSDDYASTMAVSPSKPQQPPVSCEGFLERKQIMLNGQKSSSRSWKTLYTVLCGQLLCFFKDKNAFLANEAAASPIPMMNARCQKASDYKKKKHVFSIESVDSTKYLFAASSESQLYDWINKITFRSSLPPSMQLMANNETLSSMSSTGSLKPGERLRSSTSSSSSVPCSQQPAENGNPTYTNLQTLQEGPLNGEPKPSEEPTYTNGNVDNHHAAPKTYSNVGAASKHMSLPPNMPPPQSSSGSLHDTESLHEPVSSSASVDDNISLNDKRRPKKRLSFFRRKNKN